MVEISKASYENEIHRADSPFKEDSIFFCQGGPNLGLEIYRKWPKTWKPIFMQIREWSIVLGSTGLYSMVLKSLHCFDFPV